MTFPNIIFGFFYQLVIYPINKPTAIAVQNIVHKTIKSWCLPNLFFILCILVDKMARNNWLIK